MDDEMFGKVSMSITGPSEFTKRKLVYCPHCHEPLVVPISVSVRDAVKPEHYAVEKTWRDVMDPDQVAMVDQAQQSGLFEAFAQAVRRAKGDHTPTRLEAFFILTLKTMAPKRVPSFVITHFRREFPQFTLEFWASEGVMAVVGDGRMLAFLPTDLAMGAAIKSFSGTKSGLRASASEDVLREWSKTRWGYVPSEASVFHQELRVRALGEFSRPRL